MTLTRLITVFSLVVACGDNRAPAHPTTPIADPIPMNETRQERVASVEPSILAAPEPVPVAPDPAPVDPGPAAAVVHEGHTPNPPVKPKKQPQPAAPTRVDIVVTRAGFEPKNVTVPRGKPVILRFERQVERTCGTEVVMVVDGQTITKDLPLGKPVDLAITFGTAGVVKYACAMDMIRGSITVQ